MSKLIRMTLASFFVTLAGVSLTACDDGPFEEAGEEIDNIGDEIDDEF